MVKIWCIFDRRIRICKRNEMTRTTGVLIFGCEWKSMDSWVVALIIALYIGYITMRLLISSILIYNMQGKWYRLWSTVRQSVLWPENLLPTVSRGHLIFVSWRNLWEVCGLSHMYCHKYPLIIVCNISFFYFSFLQC